ncbi:unnamed protein product [Rhizoctonia solani]|uniref:Uncharacterized protein n=1 Tax=Rhizoctonia solani TaxID=456999 RepID=A0A8H2XJB7_9AGAM|nr:unnamed protein product [Rhizoctonia solani]
MIAGDTLSSMGKAFSTGQEQLVRRMQGYPLGTKAKFLDKCDISKPDKQVAEVKKKKSKGKARPAISSVAPTTTATASTGNSPTSFGELLALCSIMYRS